jgi:uncharacterized paraquat-inducible protein A
MSESERVESEVKQAEIVCAKCHQRSQRGHGRCTHCGAHLYVTCNECGYRNDRSATHCTRCKHNLHRSFWRRLTKKHPKIAPVHILVIIVIFTVGLVLVIALPRLLELFGSMIPDQAPP